MYTYLSFIVYVFILRSWITDWCKVFAMYIQFRVTNFGQSIASQLAVNFVNHIFLNGLYTRTIRKKTLTKGRKKEENLKQLLVLLGNEEHEQKMQPRHCHMKTLPRP